MIEVMMELDDLKNTWLSLDKKLDKNKFLKETIIKEMLRTKGDKSLNKLMLSEITGFIVCLLVIPFIAYWFSRFGGKFLLQDILMGFSALISVVYVIWGGYKIKGLMKVDLSKEVRSNIYQISKFDRQLKRERLIMTFVVPILGVLVTLCYGQLRVGAYLWVFATCLFILCSLITYWSYTIFYPKSIASIKKSLDELKELEEEE